MENYLQTEFPAADPNIALARTLAAAFAAQQNPTLTELMDVKTAVSEAVSNAIVHGYRGMADGRVFLRMFVRGRTLRLVVEDSGVGIADVDKARQPLYTTRPEEERSGMGFTVMEMLCDQVEVTSAVGKGTTVTLTKTLSGRG